MIFDLFLTAATNFRSVIRCSGSYVKSSSQPPSSIMNFRLLVTLLLVTLPLVTPVGEGWQVIAVPSMDDLRQRSIRKEAELVRSLLSGLDFFFGWYEEQDSVGLLIPAGLIDPLAGISRGLMGVPPLFSMTPDELAAYVCSYGLARSGCTAISAAS